MKKLLLMAVLFCFAAAPAAMAQNYETPQQVEQQQAQSQSRENIRCDDSGAFVDQTGGGGICKSEVYQLRQECRERQYEYRESKYDSWTRHSSVKLIEGRKKPCGKIE